MRGTRAFMEIHYNSRQLLVASGGTTIRAATPAVILLGFADYKLAALEIALFANALKACGA
jgi:hypothetical protein